MWRHLARCSGKIEHREGGGGRKGWAVSDVDITNSDSE